MITRQMKGRINEVREVNARARAVVETLGQISDGSALTNVRQVMFERWSAENERAIKQAIFTAWKVNYQQLGDGGEEGNGKAEETKAGKLDPIKKREIMHVSVFLQADSPQIRVIGRGCLLVQNVFSSEVFSVFHSPIFCSTCISLLLDRV